MIKLLYFRTQIKGIDPANFIDPNKRSWKDQQCLGRRAYLLIGLMITCYSFTRKRESCQGVDHSIPSDIIDPNTKCEGSMYIGAGLARWRRAQLWDRDTAGRCRCSQPGKHSHLSRNLQPICARRFFVFVSLRFCGFPLEEDLFSVCTSSEWWGGRACEYCLSSGPVCLPISGGLL